MNNNKIFSLLRFIEHIGLLLFVGGVLGVVWWYFSLGTEPLTVGAIAITTSLSGAVLFIWMGNKISKKFDLLGSQSDFAINAQFMALFERSPVPYIIIDRDGKITRINQVAVQLFRSTAAALLNTNFLERLVESDKSDVSIILNKIKSGVTMNDVEVAVQTEVGGKVWILFSSYTSPHQDQIFVSLVDITQAKKIDEAKSEFLALATHQLRTPISAIRWNTELLRKKIPGDFFETVERYIEKIQRNTERMSALIDDFLNVSKLELGTFATDPEEIQMSVFLDTTVDEFSQKFVEKNITLLRSDQPEGFSFTTDERLLNIIVSNLLSNASKYVKPSGTVWLETRVQNNKYHIRIADDGIGIPNDELGKLFTKFYRASNATKHQAEGTGLGLYVVKQAVEKLGGTIEVSSDSDRGAEFFVTIPLR